MTVVSAHQHISAARRLLTPHLAFDRGDSAAVERNHDAATDRSAPAGRDPSPLWWAQAAMSWHRPQLTEAEVLQSVVEGVAALVPSTLGAAVLSGPRSGPESGRVQVLAISGSLPGFITAAGQDAADGTLPVAAQLPGTAGLGRECNGWPIATTQARMGGHGALIWVPLGYGAAMCGTLVIASADAVSEGVEAHAVLTAMHASTAVAAARQRAHLRSALDTRDVVGQAKGIVMERLRVTADVAFEMLSRASQDTNVKVRDVCVGVCASGDLGILRSTSRPR